MNCAKAFSTVGLALEAIRTLFSRMRYFIGLPFGLKSCEINNEFMVLWHNKPLCMAVN